MPQLYASIKIICDDAGLVKPVIFNLDQFPDSYLFDRHKTKLRAPFPISALPKCYSEAKYQLTPVLNMQQ